MPGGIPIPGQDPPDAGAVDAGYDDATLKACEDARVADIAEATRLQALAMEKNKAAQGSSPSPSSSPGKKGG
jgi:hypothetical protein